MAELKQYRSFCGIALKAEPKLIKLNQRAVFPITFWEYPDLGLLTYSGPEAKICNFKIPDLKGIGITRHELKAINCELQPKLYATIYELCDTNYKLQHRSEI